MTDLTDLIRQRDELTEQIAEIKLRQSQQGKAALDMPLPDNDAAAKTVREYLSILLSTLWEQGERFDSKRPFGNSGWRYDLFEPLIEAGRVETRDEAERVIAEAIVEMCKEGQDR